MKICSQNFGNLFSCHSKKWRVRKRISTVEQLRAPSKGPLLALRFGDVSIWMGKSGHITVTTKMHGLMGTIYN